MGHSEKNDKPVAKRGHNGVPKESTHGSAPRGPGNVSVVPQVRTTVCSLASVSEVVY